MTSVTWPPSHARRWSSDHPQGNGHGPARARIVDRLSSLVSRDCPSESWRSRGNGKTHTPPLDALDRRAGGTGAVGTALKRLTPLRVRGVGKGKGLIRRLSRVSYLDNSIYVATNFRTRVVSECTLAQATALYTARH